MKKRLLCLLVAVMVAVSFCSCSTSDSVLQTLALHTPFASADSVSRTTDLTEEVRGTWIASVYNINFPSSPDLSEKELKAELDSIVKSIKSYNMNTVYFQVHPASDAFYRSDLFPVSKYLFTDGILHFDPLEYMVNICRENDIAIYAWVNPLRVSVEASDSAEEARNILPKGSPGKDADMTVFYGDGKLYLDCGRPAVRQLVAKAVKEIVTAYNVDGVVFDDYFYPYPVSDGSGNVCIFDDSASYKASKTSLSLDDWRRENVNNLIKQCYTEIKKIDPELQFGVAPFGIWQNNNGTNGGSATEGMEAYSELYCDAVSWIKGKYVDFISPQLYWRCDSMAAPFGELVSFWNTVADGTGVDLIVSHGIYQYETWNDPQGELVSQTKLARKCVTYRGSILYGFEALQNNVSGVADDAKASFADRVYYYHPADYPTGIVLDVGNNVSVEGSEVIFDGYSDPNYSLTVNGIPVSRSYGGYFKCRLALDKGENKFTFVCGKTEKTVTVINNN